MLVALAAGGLGSDIVVQGREPSRIDAPELAIKPSPTVLSESDWSAIVKEHRRHRQAAVPADGSALSPLAIDPLAEQGYLTASNPDLGDGFGYSVAADGPLVVVGAPYESSNGTSPGDNSKRQSGAAYIFYRTATSWVEVAYLKASNPDTGDLFGHSVAVSDSTNTVVVGAWGEDGIEFDPTANFNRNSGAVYVFQLSPSGCGISPPACLPTNWTQQAYLKAHNPRVDDHFSKVAISGDTIVVGAPERDDVQLPGSGVIFVFTRTASVWTQQQEMIAPIQYINASFGWSVAIDGDTVVAGMPTDFTISFLSRAIVFKRTGTTWAVEATLQATNQDANDRFGSGVGVSGDTIVVGAHQESSNGSSPSDNSRTSAGAAYVFTRSGAGWTQRAYLKAASTRQFEEFGYSTAISGNVIVVGAPCIQQSFCSPSGAAYVFTPPSGSDWSTSAGQSEQQKLTGSNEQLRDQFGFAVAVGGGTVAVGNWTETAGGLASAGAAYAFGSTAAATLVSISVTAQSNTIVQGMSTQFTATGSYSDGSSADITTQVQWTSSTGAVTISPTGNATGVIPGTTEITGSLSGVTSNGVTLTVTNKLSQAITFDPLPNQIVGAQFAVSATSSSGLPVSFATSGSCQIAGTIVTTVEIGSCTVTATQSGNATYAAAQPVARSFLIRSFSQTSLRSSTASASRGQTVTFTALVTASGQAQGDVLLNDYGVALPNATATLVGGEASFDITTLGIGDHLITATYGGNQFFFGSTSIAVPVSVVGASGLDESSGTAARAILIGSAFGVPITPIDQSDGGFGRNASETADSANLGHSFANGNLSVQSSGLSSPLGPQVGAYSRVNSGVIGCGRNCPQGTTAARGIAYAKLRNDTPDPSIGQTANATLEGTFAAGNPGRLTARIYVFDADEFVDAIDASHQSLAEFLLGGDRLEDYAADNEPALSLARLFPTALKGTPAVITLNGPVNTTVNQLVQTGPYDVLPGQSVIVVFDITSYQAAAGMVDFSATLKPAPVFLSDSTGQPALMTAVGPFTPAPPAAVNLALTPGSTTSAISTPVTLTATATTASGAPVPDTIVSWEIVSGPNAQQIGPAMTDANGQVSFTYSGGENGGIDVIHARIGSLESNAAEITWTTSGPLDQTPPGIVPYVSGAPGQNNWFVGDIAVSWTVSEPESPESLQAAGCGNSLVTNDTAAQVLTCQATSSGGSATESVTVKRDATKPTVTYTGNAGSYSLLDAVAITCVAADNLSGVSSSTCTNAAGPAWTFGAGPHVLSAEAIDAAGNIGSGSSSFTVVITGGSLCGLTQQFVAGSPRYLALTPRQRLVVNRLTDALCDTLARVVPRLSPSQKTTLVRAYRLEVEALFKDGWLTSAQKSALQELAGGL